MKHEPRIARKKQGLEVERDDAACHLGYEEFFTTRKAALKLPSNSCLLLLAMTGKSLGTRLTYGA